MGGLIVEESMDLRQERLEFKLGFKGAYLG